VPATGEPPRRPGPQPAPTSWERHGGAASGPLRYRRREPEKTLLHTIFREHLESFLAQARERSSHGRGLPAFVERAHTPIVDSCAEALHASDARTAASSGSSHGFAPPPDGQAWQRIPDAVEEGKVALSARESVEIHVPSGPTSFGRREAGFCQASFPSLMQASYGESRLPEGYRRRRFGLDAPGGACNWRMCSREVRSSFCSRHLMAGQGRAYARGVRHLRPDLTRERQTDIAAGLHDGIALPDGPSRLARARGVAPHLYRRGHLSLLFLCRALRRDLSRFVNEGEPR
jgi:hypothetical protein